MDRGKVGDTDNVIAFPLASDEFKDAAVWLVRLDKGLGASERAKLDEWLLKSPKNAQALHELATFWGDLDLLNGQTMRVAEAAPGAPQRGTRVVGWKLAAAIIATCGIGMFTYLRQPPANPLAPITAQFNQTFRTSVGERTTAQLPDGSSITLNTNTEVQVVFQDHDRIVDMRRGEAHFTVAHDVSRPFGVRAAGHIVQAVGTAFNVHIQQAGEVEITVTDGIVQILDDAPTAAVGAAAPATQQWWKNSLIGTGLGQGQVARLSKHLPHTPLVPEIVQLAPEDLDIKLAWQRGVLIFEGESLQAVLAEFSRYTTTEFALGNEQLAEVRVGGYFNAGDIDGLLQTLSENFQIKAERTANNQILLLQDN
jgi:transmembrane sensor